MTKAELKKELEEKQKIIDEQKKKIRDQNEAAKKKWETVSCRLPKGTKDRIKNNKLTINGFINTLVLEKLEELENN